MISQQQINSIAQKLPYGAGREIAKMAGVSQALVSLFLNGKLKAMESKGAMSILEACVKYINDETVRMNKLESDVKKIV